MLVLIFALPHTWTTAHDMKRVMARMSDVLHNIAGEPHAQAVAAPVNEDLNDEDDEAVEENALAEQAAVEKKAAKAVAKQQKVAWIGSSQTSAEGKQMYRCAVCHKVDTICPS